MVPFNSLARNPSMPKSMLHSWWIFFGWSQIPSFCSETYKMMSISAAFVTGKQAYVETLKLLWLDLTWCSCGFSRGATGLDFSRCSSQRPWFDFYGGQRVVQVPTGISPTWKPKTSYFGTTISFKIGSWAMAGVSVSFIQKITTFFFFCGKKSGSPNLWWRELGLLSSAAGLFLGGAHPPKRNSGRPSSNFLGPSR